MGHIRRDKDALGISDVDPVSKILTKYLSNSIVTAFLQFITCDYEDFKLYSKQIAYNIYTEIYIYISLVWCMFVTKMRSGIVKTIWFLGATIDSNMQPYSMFTMITFFANHIGIFWSSPQSLVIEQFVQFKFVTIRY